MIITSARNEGLLIRIAPFEPAKYNNVMSLFSNQFDIFERNKESSVDLLGNEFSKPTDRRRVACRDAEPNNANTMAANVRTCQRIELIETRSGEKSNEFKNYLRCFDASNVMLDGLDIWIDALDIRIRMMTKNMLIRLLCCERDVNARTKKKLFLLFFFKPKPTMKRHLENHVCACRLAKSMDSS